MLKLAIEYLVHGFRSSWKLYATNVLSLMAILLLFGYLEGARRQLNLRNTVFSGETVVKLKADLPGAEAALRTGLPGLKSVSRKIRAPVGYKALGKDAVGQAELLGAELGADLRAGEDEPLASWLEFASGRPMRNDQEILVPSPSARIRAWASAIPSRSEAGPRGARSIPRYSGSAGSIARPSSASSTRLA